MKGKRFLLWVAIVMAVLGVVSPIFTPKPALAGGDFQTPVVLDFGMSEIEYFDRVGFWLYPGDETTVHPWYPGEAYPASEVDFAGGTIPFRIYNDTADPVWIREGAERFVLRGGRFP
ncbi:hypothetical protein L6258_01560, partial [Candidatus Parcubacteria bacterium]|nr:hypothetical protein [Candidatus Parcubacteria bacterium]